MPSTPTKILVVEDSESDFDLLSLRLAHQAFPVRLERVENEAEMRAALNACSPDLVISDHKLPRFSLSGALRVLREHDPEIPLIVVSGAIGEEAAVDAMLDGADDFIMKGNLSRLAPAITRSLNAAATVRRQRQAETALRERESMLSSLAANLPAMMFRLDFARDAGSFTLAYAGEGSQRMFGVDPEALRSDPGPLLNAIAPEDRIELFERLAGAADERTDLVWQGRLAAPDDYGPRWVQLSATLREVRGTHVYWDGIVYEITDVKRAEEEIRELTAHLEGAKEAERADVAREIHDDIGAIFFALKVDLAWLRKRIPTEPAIRDRLASIEAQIDSGVQASQRIVRSLRPAVLDFGVIGAAEWLAGDFAKRTGIACDFRADVDELPLAPELGTAIFRVLQESLTNISRHAQASEIHVRIRVDSEVVWLDVADNGRGIDSADLGKRNSFGVRGMRERAIEHGGSLEISAAEGAGTRLCMRLPVRLAEDA
jgi:signal transduction histidine kinase